MCPSSNNKSVTRAPERGERIAHRKGLRFELDVGRRSNFIREWAGDSRFALRSCQRDWRVASVACLMIAFGVGSAAAVFSVVDQVLLQPPVGVHAGSSVAYLQLLAPGDAGGSAGEGISTVSFDQLRRAATSLAGMASYVELQATASVDRDHPVQVDGNAVYGSFFEILGVQASTGRLLNDRDSRVGENPNLIVISQTLRNRIFGSRLAIGQSISLDGVPFTVLGVAGGGFAGANRANVSDFWIPYGALALLYRSDIESPKMRIHRDILVRARDGVAMSAAAAQLSTIVRGLALSVNEDAPATAILRPSLFRGLATPPILRSRTRRSMILLTVLAGMVLLIVCANMSNVLLVRGLKRRSTTTTLMALGASRIRIARQELTFSVLLGLAGAAAGIPLAWALCMLLKQGNFVDIPVVSGLQFSLALILFLPAAGVIAGALCGVIPAALAARLDLASGLRKGAITHSGQRRMIRLAFSTAQIAMSLTMTVGALLLLHTVRNLYDVQTGVNTDDVLALNLHHSPRLEPAEVDLLHRRVISAARALPNVEDAALDPYGLPEGIIAKIGAAGDRATKPLKAHMVPVTPGLLHILQIPLVDGRAFRDNDWGFDKPGGVLLTASLARKLFGQVQVAGRQVALSPSKKETILGVVADIRPPSSRAPEDAFFVTYGDIALLRLQYFTLLVRTYRFDAQIPQRVRAAVQDALPTEAVPEVRLLRDDVRQAFSEPLVLTRLLSLLALLGVAVAAVGLYSVIATMVEERRRELAIRLALGAKPNEIGRMVAVQAVRIASMGTAIGLGGAYALGRVLRRELFEVGPADPMSYITAVVLSAAVTAAATLGPTRHAMSMDTVRTLREA